MGGRDGRRPEAERAGGTAPAVTVPAQSGGLAATGGRGSVTAAAVRAGVVAWLPSQVGGCGDGVAVLREPRRGAVRPVGAAQAAGVALGAATRHTRVAMPLPVPLVSAGQPAARASRLGEPTRRFGRRSGPDRAETRHPDSGRGHLRGNGQGHLRDLVAAPQVGASGLSSAQRARCRGGDAGRPRAWCRRRRSGRRTWCSAARPDARACVVFRRRT